MATQSLEFGYTSGATLTAKLFAIGDDKSTVVQTASAVTEQTDGDTHATGRYIATFTDAAAADYLLIAYDTNVGVHHENYSVVLATATFQPWSEQVDLSQLETDVQQILDDLDNAAISSGGATIIDTTINTLTSQTEFALAAGSPDDDAYNGRPILITDASTANQIALGLVDDYVGSTKTITLRSDPGVFTMAASDAVKIFAFPEVGTVTAVSVDKSRTWLLQAGDEGAEAPNVVTVKTGTVTTLAMDFGAVLNEDTALSSAVSLSFTSGIALTYSGLTLSQDRRKAHVKMTCDSVGERKVKITVLTTDSQTLTGEGYLTVE